MESVRAARRRTAHTRPRVFIADAASIFGFERLFDAREQHHTVLVANANRRVINSAHHMHPRRVGRGLEQRRGLGGLQSSIGIATQHTFHGALAARFAALTRPIGDLT